jgi:6-phosphogluconate dehydrogenase
MPTFGLTGLATMGANLARNVARNGFEIVVHNRTTERLERFLEEHGDEGAITGASSMEDLVGKLERPRTVMVMVKAGDAVDAVISELAPLLDEGDTIADGGNSHFRDSRRRSEELAERGLRFLGVGVSGGEEGALNGPSIMPGGDEGAYRDVEEILTTIAAQVDGTPCCTYVGPGGAGHYVKMVHNGIEYGDMQLIAEAYDLLRAGVGMSLEEIAGTFREWNEGPLESFLIEIAATVLSQPDDRGERSGDERSARGRSALLDAILDEAEQKGTGRWTAQDALELGIPLTTITEAVFARSLSALRSAMATIWRGGCIIRARFLDRIREAYDEDPHTANLLQVEPFRREIAEAQDPWRRVVATAVELGIPAPAFSSALAYYDGYRRIHGPANLIQGLRDLFGAHTYRRVDSGDETFHTSWGE